MRTQQRGLGTASIPRLATERLSIAGNLAGAPAGVGKTPRRDVSVSGRTPRSRAHSGSESERATMRDATMSLDGRIEESIRPVSRVSKVVSTGRRVGSVIRTVSFPGMPGSIMGGQIWEEFAKYHFGCHCPNKCRAVEIGRIMRANRSRGPCESVG